MEINIFKALDSIVESKDFNDLKLDEKNLNNLQKAKVYYFINAVKHLFMKHE